jgi:regulator of sirC expression with transglutaminase-like and TPR domain
MTEADLSLFAHVVGRDDAHVDLAQAALMIAEGEYPGLDIPAYISALDRFGARARRAVVAAPADPPMATVLRVLYGDLGFHGNAGDYYDPRNSFLNEVLDRRTGIPISLALVLTETCRRVGIDARGVSFPGHFLVRVQTDDGDVMFLDPFDGKLLDEGQIAELHERATGDSGPVDPGLLDPASKGHVLMRLLNNLRAIYERTGDHDRLLGVLARMQVLSPDEDIRSRIRQLAGSSPLGGSGTGTGSVLN